MYKLATILSLILIGIILKKLGTKQYRWEKECAEEHNMEESHSISNIVYALYTIETVATEMFAIYLLFISP